MASEKGVINPLRFASGIPRASAMPSACGGIIQLTNIPALRL
ncbi:MAG: hypothetical protein WCO53_13490 [Deltaproteobacteria bacterium]